MKELIKKLLSEAIKSGHWVRDSYPTRIETSTLKDMDPIHREEIDKRLNFIESLEFSDNQPQKIGVWVYETPKPVLHEPFTPRDKGALLLAIVNNNNMTTLYWKHKFEGQYDYDITYKELLEFAASDFYDEQTNPITIKNLQAFNKSKRVVQPSEPRTDRFKKLKLPNGKIVRYYEALTKFETLEGQPIDNYDIIDELPEELQDKILSSMDESIGSVFENMEMLGEDYPSSFDMDVFKSLNSFSKRIKYCEENLKRISSGSSRIVYMIDNEKVLKLAKNDKGLAQNEVEAEYSNYSDISDIAARVFDVHPDNLWIEMELARKLTSSDFKRISGFDWKDFQVAIYNYGLDVSGSSRRGGKIDLDQEIYQAMWDNEGFVYDMFNFMGNYGIPAGDLRRTSSYGIVKRNGQDVIVMIDYGLTSEVYDSYYS